MERAAVMASSALQTPSFGGQEVEFTPAKTSDMGVVALRRSGLFCVRVEGPNDSHAFTRDIPPFISQKRGVANTDRPENMRSRP